MFDRRQVHDSVRRARRTALAAGIALAFCLPYQAAAQGGFDGPGRYEITNLKSGKVLDLDRNDKTSVIQYSSRGTDNQAWEIRTAGGGFYSVRNRMNGYALEAVGTGNSNPVRATKFDGRSGQQWRIDAGHGGNALIVSQSGKTLDVPGGTSREGAPVQTYEYNGDLNQQFKFRRLDGNLAARVGGSAPNGNAVDIPASMARGAGAGRTALKPGWNMFSVEQDVELGQQASGEVARQVLLLNEARVDSYLKNLGQRLSAHAPGYKFPYAFQAVNDKGINAFALPGGNIYVNRGTIEAATSEAQLAGVMAHEISHVALRHGTNQASKASAVQTPLAILGGLLGSNSTASALAQLGAGFTVNSILLKYSRDAESQADLMGTQILFDAGYDPRGMGQFFETLQAQDEGGNRVAFFNSHPNPDRRVQSTNEEVARLGGGSGNVSRNSSQEFDRIKRQVQAMPAPRPNQIQAQQPQQNTPTGPAATAERYLTFENSMLRIGHPENWQAFGHADAITLTPSGGMVSDAGGNQAMAYGVVVNIYDSRSDRYGQQLQGPGFGQGAAVPIGEATDQLVQELRQSNRNMRVLRRQGSIDFGGQRGLSTYLSNDSPVQGGGRETNWLVTVPRPEGLLFFVFTAPEREFPSYENAFQQILHSVRMKQ